MRIVSLEENVCFPENGGRSKEASSHPVPMLKLIEKVFPKLSDISGERIKSMNENGISMQVLSIINPGGDLVDEKPGEIIAGNYNDLLAERISPFREQFAAFAHLPMRSPDAAAEELKRTVEQHKFKGAMISGMTNNEFLDDSKYRVIFKIAEQLDVSIYLHPAFRRNLLSRPTIAICQEMLGRYSP